MGRSQGFKPGDHKFLLELEPDLSLDLHAFCEIHYGAPKAEVARRALRMLIDAETSTDPRTRQKFDEIRQRLAGGNGMPLRLVKAERTASNKQ